jgi:hypothetical protein
LKRRSTAGSSEGRNPRQISSTEITHTHGSVPVRRSPAILDAAGLPRSASIKTVESSSSRPMSTGAPRVTVTLSADPCRRIRVPIVHGVGEGSKGRLDVVPTAFIVQAAPDEFGDECAPLSGADSSIQFSDKLVRQRYVHTHVPIIAHSFGRHMLSMCAGRNIKMPGCRRSGTG